MQQQQCLRVRRARFAIENIEALDIGLPKADLCMTGLNDPRTPLTAVISGKSASVHHRHLRKSALEAPRRSA
jgi:hypothetical protein